MSAYSFGRTDRDQASRVFITSRHEKSQLLKHSPGAGSYEQQGSFNKQALSKSINAPSTAFGKSAKLGQPKSETPGEWTLRFGSCCRDSRLTESLLPCRPRVILGLVAAPSRNSQGYSERRPPTA